MTQPARAVSPDADTQSVAEAIALELAAGELYAKAIESQAGDPLWATLRDQHSAFGQRLAGLVGISANSPDEAFMQELESALAVADPARGAVELENELAAQHTNRLAGITNAEVAAVLAAIVASEARHALLAARLAGITDPDELFVNTAVTTTRAGA